MKWQIPAKTFLVGEYIALAQAPAILVTTKPCFNFSLQERGNSSIHPDSPAGRFWVKSGHTLNQIHWQDPYLGRGGLGASSAQFIGAYLASCYLKKIPAEGQALLTGYYQHAWRGEGVKPSGYDIIAQAQHGCVYIDQKNNQLHCYDWAFKDISFVLLHTGNKLATHHHLQEIKLPNSLNELPKLVEQAETAFIENNSAKLITAINSYQHELTKLNLVAPTTLQLLKLFKTNPDVLAIKGCGALGMDVLLLIIPSDKLMTLCNFFKEEHWTVLATNKELYQSKDLVEFH
ncbi:Uncharacterised protein [Legionella beliardensis]|uniref:Mevalonate kinase n=1 Tax=Legionella beliardensis TaxID=91822 RepID=A0A378I3Q0_9GAMM|nr:hypothetical protein [Legionella beliardensis]STX29798.1 Uncharacterised protein [Legionella beliardensis]